MPRLLILAIWPFLAIVGHAAEDHAFPIARDTDIQTRIDRVIRSVMEKTGRPEIVASIDKELEDIATKRPEDLVRQLLYYCENEDSERAQHAMHLLYYLRIPESSIALAVLPYLETTHPGLRNEIESLLRTIEGADRMESRLDFSHYLVGIRLTDNPPLVLIRRMYQRSPSSALLEMSKVFTQWKEYKRHKEVLWAEHVVTDTVWKHEHGFLDKKTVEPEAAVQIEKAAGDSQWWVRLYAAEIMRQHPGFRRADLLRKLAEDDHQLVRESAEASQAKPTPKSPPSPPPSSSANEQKK